MRINAFKKVLKGRNNIAQGIALGLEMERKIVREKMMINRKLFIADEKGYQIFSEFWHSLYSSESILSPDLSFSRGRLLHVFLYPGCCFSRSF